MRWWAIALGIVVVAAIGAGAYWLASAPLPQSQVNAPQARVVSRAEIPQPAPMWKRGIRSADDAYRRHRPGFKNVSDYSDRARHNLIVDLFGFAVFVLLTLPKNSRGVRAFYRQMMVRAPLSEDDGITDEDNRQARKVLFFYLLFLLYQIVQFPLTLGHGRGVPFYSDLVFQTVLLILVATAFHDLKRGLNRRWAGDAERQEKMRRWLDTRLEGLAIRWRDIRMLAVGVFVAGFAPAVLAHLTDWLDVAADWAQRMAGS